ERPQASSLPAEAGNPVIGARETLLNRHGVLDHPLSRMMTTTGLSAAVHRYKRGAVFQAQLVRVADAGGIAQVELFDPDAARGLHVGAALDPRQILVEAREQHPRAPARGLDPRRPRRWSAAGAATGTPRTRPRATAGRSPPLATGMNGGPPPLAMSASASWFGAVIARTPTNSAEKPSRRPNLGCTGANKCFSS